MYALIIFIIAIIVIWEFLKFKLLNKKSDKEELNNHISKLLDDNDNLISKNNELADKNEYLSTENGEVKKEKKHLKGKVENIDKLKEEIEDKKEKIKKLKHSYTSKDNQDKFYMPYKKLTPDKLEIISGKIYKFENHEATNVIETIKLIFEKDKKENISTYKSNEFSFLYAIKLGNSVAKFGIVHTFGNILNRLGDFGFSYNENGLTNGYNQEVSLWIVEFPFKTPNSQSSKEEKETQDKNIEFLESIEKKILKQIESKFGKEFYTSWGRNINGSSEMFSINNENNFNEFVNKISDEISKDENINSRINNFENNNFVNK